MEKLSKRRLLIEACTVCFEPHEIKSTKFVAFWRSDEERVYLIGKSAALRVVRRDEPVANSRSHTGNRTYRALLVVGKRAANDCYSSREQALADLAAEVARPNIADIEARSRVTEDRLAAMGFFD